MLPGMQKPYYLSYTLGRTHQFEVVGALGGVTNFYSLLECRWWGADVLEITIIIMILIMYVLLFRLECRNRLIMM